MNPLKELLELAGKREDIDAAILGKVAHARAEGHSWQAIANVIGGTKQAAQQRYGKAVEPLMEQGRYDCNCGWTMIYPGWEATEAWEEINEHQQMHEREDEHAEQDNYGTEPVELGQLENETATHIDEAPATAAAAYEYEWQNPEPRRLDVPTVDTEDDLSRVESGELDTEGNTINWAGLKAPRCLYCGKTHHYDGKGRDLYFWLYPGCNPTHRDESQYKPATTPKAEPTTQAQAGEIDLLTEMDASEATRRFKAKAETLGLTTEVSLRADNDQLSVFVKHTDAGRGMVMLSQFPGKDGRGHRHLYSYLDQPFSLSGKWKPCSYAKAVQFMQVLAI